MINAIKEQKNDTLLVRLVGSIEETVNFDELIGPTPKNLEINCKEVVRINSVGIKLWIKYFQSCEAKGTSLTFTECSPCIVEQFNLISNFSCGGKIESIYVPFLCVDCQSELLGLFKTEDLKRIQFKLPELKCTKCSGRAVFDDLPEEYFHFLTR